MANGEYSHAELMAMQRDAVRRVHEMQKLAAQKLQGSGNDSPQGGSSAKSTMERQESAHPAANANSKNSKQQQKSAPPEPAADASKQPDSSPPEKSAEKQPIAGGSIIDNLLEGVGIGNPVSSLEGFIDRMDLDKETIMIIMLLLLLVNDGADSMLILALVYILL